MAKPHYSHPPEPITNQGNDCLGRIEVNSWFHYPSPLMSRYSNYYPAVPITLPRPNHFITYLGLLSDAQATCTDGTKSAMNEFLWTWHDDTSSELLSNAFSTGFMKTIDLEGPSRGNTTIFHVESYGRRVEVWWTLRGTAMMNFVMLPRAFWRTLFLRLENVCTIFLLRLMRTMLPYDVGLVIAICT